MTMTGGERTSSYSTLDIDAADGPNEDPMYEMVFRLSVVYRPAGVVAVFESDVGCSSTSLATEQG